MGVNYGTNKVRFPSPVPVGSKLRSARRSPSVEDVAGGAQIAMGSFEIEGAPKPACVAEVGLPLLRLTPAAQRNSGMTVVAKSSRLVVSG